ncbi:Pentapeptide repeats (8 copies) [Pseudovibrio sp. Ad13]|uniref:pentapeptide repeat-containing protein n=1 Tax=Pseudovibrio sp. Ad13 TaxID=989396 RepID=UPI0007AE56A2|nr:pentapeptide repeat-containing protein [Pseudovibrio sp. Ad13]KZK83584.1 Pentapeptide repeats (8 copies) [Pseudovibrio sp. Ad13]
MDQESSIESTNVLMPIGAGIYAMVLIFALVCAIFVPDNPLKFWFPDNESGAEIWRNIGLLVVGLVGFPFIIWRSITAHWQAQISNKQAGIALGQLQNADRTLVLAEKRHITDRFAEAVELLGKDNSASASAGVIMLKDLMEASTTYFDTSMDLLEQHIRKRNIERSTFKSDQPVPIQAFFIDQGVAIRAVINLRNNQDQNSLKLFDFANTNMDCVEFNKITKINFHKCRLENCIFNGLNLSLADFSASMLVATDFSRSRLVGANFVGADLPDTDSINFNYRLYMESFSSIQFQIDKAHEEHATEMVVAIQSYTLRLTDKSTAREIVSELNRIAQNHQTYINDFNQVILNSTNAVKQIGQHFLLPKLMQMGGYAMTVPRFEGAEVFGAFIEAKFFPLFSEEQWNSVNVIDRDGNTMQRPFTPSSEPA